MGHNFRISLSITVRLRVRCTDAVIGADERTTYYFSHPRERKRISGGQARKTRKFTELSRPKGSNLSPSPIKKEPFARLHFDWCG